MTPQPPLVDELLAQAERQAQALIEKARHEASVLMAEAADKVAGLTERELGRGRAEGERRRAVILSTVPLRERRLRQLRAGRDHGLQYVGAARIDGPLVVVERARGVGYDELVELRDSSGEVRLGRVLDTSEQQVVVQVLEGTSGLSGATVRTRFLGDSFRLPVSRDMLGRIFDGQGRPLDGGAPPLGEDRRDVNSTPLNPYARRYPREFIQTGISAIDGMNAPAHRHDQLLRKPA